MSTKSKFSLIIIVLAAVISAQVAANFVSLKKGFVNTRTSDFPSLKSFGKYQIRLILSAIYDLMPFTSNAKCDYGPDIKRYRKWVSDEEGLKEVLKDKGFSKDVNIFFFDNKKIRNSPYRFDYLVFNSKKAERFVTKYGLTNLNKDKNDELGKLAILLHWAHTRWSPHYTSRTNNHSLKEILAYKDKSFSASQIIEIDASTTMVNCPAASFLLAQVIASLGYPGRVISVGDHMACEVWSDQYGKWIYMDPYYDVYFEKDRVPLSWLDLHLLLKKIDTTWNGMSVESFEDAVAFYRQFNIDVKSLSFDGKKYEGPTDSGTFHYLSNNIFGTVFAINLRNDQIENIYPKFHVRYHKYEKLNVLWKQPGTDYRFVSTNEKWLSPKHAASFIPPKYQLPLVWQATVNIGDLYYNLNFTQICINPASINIKEKTGKIEIALGTFTPNFDSFYCSINTNTWNRCGERFVWHLRSGENRMRARSRNKYGHFGAISEIVIWL